MQEILLGEFFWGIVVGLILSFFGGWSLAKFTVSIQQENAKKTFTRFCADTINNIQGIVDEMQSTRDKTQVIYPDFLALIEIEILIYGRNREHLIHLPDEERGLVRKFMNDVATKRAEVGLQIERFNQICRQADQVQAGGSGPEAQRIRESANTPLNAAHKAADQLANVATQSVRIVEKLKLVR